MWKIYGNNIVCIAPNVNNKECTKAKNEYGINLIGMIQEDFEYADEILNRLKKENIITGKQQKIIWIGHDIITGQIALKCRDELQGSKCAIIHHMAYGEYYSMMNDDSVASWNKEDLQRNILREADFVFANGPRLKNSAMNLVGSAEEKKILEILPRLESKKDFSSNAQTFSVVAFGRVEEGSGSKKNNSIIKQTNLAVAAWASFVREEDDVIPTSMDVIGYEKSHDNQKANDEIKKFAEQYAGKVLNVRALPYVDDSDFLFQKISEKSLCMMLSKEEGFGLSCLEAISVGTTVILSESTGLYQALKERKLDNYLLSVRIEGKNESPYFTDHDLNNVKKKIHDFYHNQKTYKTNILQLREKLASNGFSWEQSIVSMIEFMGIEIKKKTVKNFCETRIVTCKGKFNDVKWFDRVDLYEQINDIYDKQRIIFVEGCYQSSKEVSMIWWAKSRGIDEEQLFYYDIAEDGESDYFKVQIEEFLGSNVRMQKQVYLLIADFPVENAKAYFKSIRMLLDNYSNLHFIIFSDEKFKEVKEIKLYYDYARISVGGLSRESVKDYFGLYGIDISEDEVDKLSSTEYLPKILNKYVDYVLDEEVEISTAIKEIDIDITLPERVLARLGKEEAMLAGVLALFEVPFSIKIAKKIAKIFGISQNSIDKLVHNAVILKNSDYSYKIPKFYRNCLREVLSENDKKRGYWEISRYYYFAYKYAWGSGLTSEDVIRGMYACKFAIKAQNYEAARKYLKEGKYALHKWGMKKGMYKSLIAMMKDVYTVYGSEDTWLAYNLVHCMLIVGEISHARNVLNGLGDVSDRDCRIALLRLRGEVKNEYEGPQKAYEYLCSEYDKPNGKVSVPDKQLWEYLIELQLQCGHYTKVLSDCKKYRKEAKSEYEKAIFMMYTAICKVQINKEQKLEDFDKVITLFEKLDDKRGILWVRKEKSLAQFDRGISGAEDDLIDIIKSEQQLEECSKGYRICLSKLCARDVGEKVGHLLEEERNRIIGIMSAKNFIPEKLRTYQYNK